MCNNLKMYSWFCFCLPAARQSPLSDESYFLPFPHTDSWCVLFTSYTSAETSSMYISPSLRKPISVVLAVMNLCASLCRALYPIRMSPFVPINPVLLQCTGSLGYIKPNFFRAEKLNMIVQMSSCPLRGIVMYAQIVVGFNCDIYEMWESNVCASFRLS